MTSQSLLVELGTEELPPKALKQLSDAFSQSVSKSLQAAGCVLGELQSFAAPRRLAFLIKEVPTKTPLVEVDVWGPPARIAYDDKGDLTRAGLAFAQKNGLSADQIQVQNDGKADKLFARLSKGGEAVSELIPAFVEQALASLPIPKRMRWGAKREEFVRPVHWLVMLMGSDIIDGRVLGLTSGRESRGHRFHHNQPIAIDHADNYAQTLATPGYVMANFQARQARIVEQVNALAKQLGGQAQMEPGLLDEVTALVEWPVALAGKFEQRFLEVPAEALISSMGEHQKYFHLLDKEGALMPYFITVANIESKDPAQVIDGNERVIRPRLSDAAFFFETDKKTRLADLRERLKSIVFQAQLGSLFDKTERVASLAAAIAKQLGADTELATRAAQLSKSDLVTNMVGEFDTMQGIAGYYYAKNDGEPEEVAQALNEQYLPRFAGDKLPETQTGTLLALADRLDTLVGIFGIGQQPTGSKDPFALRRASLGVLRLLVEKQLPLDLAELVQLAQAQHQPLPHADGLVEKVVGYMLERFRAWYEDEQINAEVFLSVAAKQLTHPLDIDKRVRAVHSFSRMPQAQALAAANKRVGNILSKLDSEPHNQVDSQLLKESAEQTLAQLLEEKQAACQPLFKAGDYAQALSLLADLQKPVDAFFDQVMVMAEDAALRNNRLALLMQLRGLFLEVADISLLVPAKA